MDYKQKYLKYKKKYIELKGGFIIPHPDYSFIKSLGFEIESGMICPFTGEIKGDTLILTPFGFNEYSKDETKNRSQVQLHVTDLKVSDTMVGKFEYTQDSYDLFEITNKIDMDASESLSIALDGNKEPFKINEPTRAIKNIQFDVDIKTGKTIGHSEFLCTFLKLDDYPLNITNCSFAVLDEISNIFKDENITLIGDIDIPYNEYRRVDADDLKSKVNIIPQILKTSIFRLNYVSNKLGKDIYIFTFMYSPSNYKRNKILNNVAMGPQITMGIDNMNFYKTLNTLGAEQDNNTNNPFLTTLNNNIKGYIEFLFNYILLNSAITPQEKEHFSDITNNTLLYNYLILLFYFTNINDFDHYEFNNVNDNIEIKKYGVPFIPRQHFYEIVDKHENLKKSIDIIYKYAKHKIIDHRIFKLSILLNKPITNMVNYENINLDYLNENIRITFNDISEDLLIKISKIIKSELKMFDIRNIEKIKGGPIKENKVDPISAYTTKIPYNGSTFLIENRLIMSKLESEIRKLYMFDGFGNNNDFKSLLFDYTINELSKTKPEKNEDLYAVHKEFNTKVTELYKAKIDQQMEILAKK